MKISYNKLVRDEIPRIILESGKRCQTRKLSTDEIQLELTRKLQEELTEFTENPSIEELADILEVIHALAACLCSDFNEVDGYRETKKLERGAFNKHIYLEWVIEDNAEQGN